MEEVVLIYGTADILKKHSQLSNVLQQRVFPPLGLLYLAAVLEKERIKVSLIDLTVAKDGIQKAIEQIKSSKPKVIGINVTSFNLYLVRLLISRIRKVSSDSRIVIGGTHVHYCPDSVIYLDADFGVISDGEYSLLALVKELFNNRSNFRHIPNLITKNSGGIEVNTLKMIEDLDNLPFPARHFWRHKFYSPLIAGRAATTVTSRGCIFGCIFCAIPNKGTFRVRSAGNVIDEFEYLERQGFKYAELLDDTFTLDKDRAKLICEELIRKKINLKWTCSTRIDCVDRQLLCLMGKAHCTHIKYGIESGSEFVRNKIMKKFIKNSQIKNVVKDTKKAGILAEGLFIVGMPGESLEDIRLTLKFSKEIGLDYADFHLGTLVPGSEIFQKATNERIIPSNIWEEVAKGQRMPYSVPDKIPLTKILYFRKKAMRDYYFSIDFLFRELFLRTKDFASLINKAKVLLKLFNLYNV